MIRHAKLDPMIHQWFEVECAADAVWTPRPLHGGTIMPKCIRKLTFRWTIFPTEQFVLSHPTFSAINCTEAPFAMRNNDMGMYNWTGVDGEDPRPYATAIKYHCPRAGQ